MKKETKASLLLVEDEENLHESLKLNLELEGYEVTSSFNGADALRAVQNEYFDLIVMDVMLPGIDGISVTETLRLQQNEVPVLMLSAKSDTESRILGLRKGADDYLSKPFNLQELLLRIEKLIIKSKKIQEKENVGDTFSFAGNKIDFKAQQADTCHGNTIELSKKEIMLLKLLIENRGDVVTREKILQMVWGYNVYPNTRTIDNFILSFRKYFEHDSRNPVHFHSVRGMGYKFIE